MELPGSSAPFWGWSWPQWYMVGAGRGFAYCPNKKKTASCTAAASVQGAGKTCRTLEVPARIQKAPREMHLGILLPFRCSVTWSVPTLQPDAFFERNCGRGTNVRDSAFCHKRILSFGDILQYGIILRVWTRLFFSPLAGELVHSWPIKKPYFFECMSIGE